MRYFLAVIAFLLLHQPLFGQTRCSVSTNNKIYYDTQFVPQTTIINFDPSTIPIGGEIYTLEGYAYYSNATVGDKVTGKFECNSIINENYISVFQRFAFIENGIYYYHTGIKGIAMSVLVQNEFTSGFINAGVYSVPGGSRSGYLPQHKFRIKLIKIDQNVGKGILQGLFAHEYIGGYTTQQYSSMINFSDFHAIKINPSQNTCSYSGQTISLPTAQIKSFNTVGQTTSSYHFNLPIQCAATIAGAPVDVYIQLVDAIKNSNNTSILTNAGSTQTGNKPAASGIGIQILKDGSPLSLGSTWKAASLPAGQPAGALQIPLEARYIQTSATVSPGSVQARATVTLSYQ